MAFPAPGGAPAPSRTLWFILGLLIVSISINYIDRSALSVAAASADFRQEMHLDDARLGLLFSAFFWTYASLQVLAGYLIDRHGVLWILTGGFVLWSVATALAGLAGGFTALLAARLLLGAGQAAAYPAYSKIIAAGFPEHRRGTANALIDGGSRTGPAICVLAGGMLAARYGWRLMFLALGAGSLLWLVPWARYASRVPAAHRDPAGSSPGLVAILRRRQAWGTFLGHFCVNYTWYFVLSWLPSYLTRERHYSAAAMAIYGALPFWGIAITCGICGWISDRLIQRGASPTRVRIAFVAGGMLLSTLMLPACVVPQEALSMTLLTAGCLSLGLVSSNVGAITQTLAGPRAAGQWMGLQNGLGNLSGIVAPYATGLMVAGTGSFYAAFLASAIVSVAAACAFIFLVGRVAPIDWS